MPLIRVSPPEPLVSYEEAKDHLRLSNDDEQTYVEALVATATAWIDGADGWLGRALGEQQWQWRSDGLEGFRRWPQEATIWITYLPVPLPPLVSVDEVLYVDANGVEQTWGSSSYVVTGVGASCGGMISLAEGASWPSVKYGPENLRVTFTAGYGAAEDVPAPIRHAILVTVKKLYEQAGAQSIRSESVDGVGSVSYLDPGDLIAGTVAALLAPYRVFR